MDTETKTFRCIYCGRQKPDAEHSLEHIWPEGLAGKFTPDFFKTREACSTCNNLLGQFVDGEFQRSFFTSVEESGAALAFLDTSRAIALPLVYMGMLADEPPGGEVCESWLGPRGESIYFLHAKDRDDFASFAGGDPIKRNTSDGGRVYISFSRPNSYWIHTAIASVREKFRNAEFRVLTVVDEPMLLMLCSPESNQSANDRAFLDFHWRAKTNHVRQTMLLDHGARFQCKLKRCGAMVAEGHFELVRQSREAMLAAISVFNNPNVTFKTEIFITNAVIAWTYLMHGYYSKKKVRYHFDEVTAGGRNKLYELGKCVKLPECPLDKLTVSNLEYLIELRHEIEHRMADGIDVAVSAKIQACAVNFDHYIATLFGEEYRINSALPFSIQLSEITLDQRKVMKTRGALPTVIETLNKAFEDRLTADELNDPRFVYRVYLTPKTSNRSAGADEAIEFVHPKSDKGEELQLALKEVEKTKLLPSAVVKQMRKEGYRWFSQHYLTVFARSVEAKDPKKAMGINLASRWFWYESVLPLVRTYCEKKGRNYVAP